LLARGFEPRSSVVDVAPPTDVELPAVVLAALDDLRDLGVVVVEDPVQQEDRPLDRLRLSSRTRKAIESESAVSACAAASGGGR